MAFLRFSVQRRTMRLLQAIAHSSFPVKSDEPVRVRTSFFQMCWFNKDKIDLPREGSEGKCWHSMVRTDFLLACRKLSTVERSGIEDQNKVAGTREKERKREGNHFSMLFTRSVCAFSPLGKIYQHHAIVSHWNLNRRHLFPSENESSRQQWWANKVRPLQNRQRTICLTLSFSLVRAGRYRTAVQRNGSTNALRCREEFRRSLCSWSSRCGRR